MSDSTEACRNDAEEWRPIRGWEGLYSVSNIGRIRSETHVVTRSDGRLYSSEGRVLKSWSNRGYLYVMLTRNRKKKNISVHRAVADAFLGPIPVGLDVNHLDGDKGNNVLANLEVVTTAENIRHAFRTGLCKPRRGEANGFSKLTDEDVRAIRARSFENQRALAAEFGVAQAVVSRIITGRGWTHIGGAREATETRGETHHSAKLTNADVLSIRERAGSVTRRELADEYGVTTDNIHRIVNGKSWKHLLPDEKPAVLPENAEILA